MAIISRNLSGGLVYGGAPLFADDLQEAKQRSVKYCISVLNLQSGGIRAFIFSPPNCPPELCIF